MAQTRIISIDTSKAQQSVKELENQVENLNKDLQNTQKEIQDLKDIPKTTNTAFKGLQSSVENTKFNITELTKAVNIAKFDIGVFGESVSKIGAGVAGGFNIVSGAIKFMGLESDETSKAISELQFYLQQIPLNLFAISEGISSFRNGFDLLKSSISSINIDNFIKPFKVIIDEEGKLRDFLNNISKDYTPGINKGLQNLHKLEEYESKIKFLKIFYNLNEINGDYLKSIGFTSKAYEKLAGDLKILQGSEEFLNATLDEQEKLFENLTQNAVNDFLKELSTWEKIQVKINYALNDGIAGSLGLAGGILALTAACAAIVASGVKEYFEGLDEASQNLYQHLQELNKPNVDGLKNAQEEIVTVQNLVKIANDETYSLKVRKDAINQLNQIVPGYNANLNETTGLYSANEKALNSYVTELKRQAVAQAAVAEITKKYQNIIEKSAELQQAEKLKEEMDALQAEYDTAYRTTGISVELREAYDAIMTKSNKKIIQNIDNLKDEISKEAEDIEYIYTTFDTYVKPAAEKAAGNAGKSAGKTFTKEFIAHLEPQEIEFTNVINKLFGRESLSDVAAREAGFTATEFMQKFQDILNLDGGLTVTINTAVGNFPENERLRQFVDYITEAQRQLAVLNDTMGRFGESSLGLGSDYANVVQDFSAMFTQMSDIIMKDGEVAFNSYTQMASSGIQAVGSLLNALSNEQNTSSREGFEAQKKYQISATVMNTLAGVINAWSSALAITPPLGPILGGINSAMIASLGAVQIAKIAKQRFGEESNVSSSAINSTLIAPTQYSQAVQNANIEQKLGDNRVFVTETDISNVQNRVRVQESENTY